MNTIDFVKTDLYDMACHQGVTFSVDLAVTEACTGLPDDLQGYSAELLVYDANVTDDIATVTGTISAPATGVVTFVISAHDTADLDVGLYSHTINLTIGSTVYRVAQGAFEVLQ